MVTINDAIERGPVKDQEEMFRKMNAAVETLAQSPAAEFN